MKSNKCKSYIRKIKKHLEDNTDKVKITLQMLKTQKHAFPQIITALNYVMAIERA